MTVQLDDNFLNDLGLGNASDVQKQAFVQQVLETLELRVGTRLAEDLSDEQLEEFEKISPQETDSPEVATQKQDHAMEWIKANHPDYEGTIVKELEKLKNELSSSLNTILDKNVG